MLKRLLSLSLCLVSVASMAAVPGYYAGLQLGYGFTPKTSATDTVDSAAITLNTDKHNGLATRVFVGYAVTPFYAMELGLARYNESSSRTLVDGTYDTHINLFTYAADVLGRFTWISRTKFKLYTSAGLAYVYGYYTSKAALAALTFHKGFYFWRPELMAGAQYALNDRWDLGLSYTYIFGRGNETKAISARNAGGYLPNISSAMLNVSYQF